MPFPLVTLEHIEAMRKANAETARRVKPWMYRGPWSAAQRARSPFNGTQHGADSLAVDYAVMYATALLGICKSIATMPVGRSRPGQDDVQVGDTAHVSPAPKLGH